MSEWSHHVRVQTTWMPIIGMDILHVMGVPLRFRNRPEDVGEVTPLVRDHSAQLISKLLSPLFATSDLSPREHPGPSRVRPRRRSLWVPARTIARLLHNSACTFINRFLMSARPLSPVLALSLYLSLSLSPLSLHFRSKLYYFFFFLFPVLSFGFLGFLGSERRMLFTSRMMPSSACSGQFSLSSGRAHRSR
jgi:hypothetical protein